MNWKKLVDRKDAETYVLPKGWWTQEEVAEQLQCSPSRVSERLRPGIQDGTFEKQTFSIWCKIQKRKVQVVAYRPSDGSTLEKDPTPESKPTPGRKAGGAPWPDEQFRRALVLRDQGQTWDQIGEAVGRSGDTVRKYLRNRRA